MIGSHQRAKWRKRVLLPCWILQIPILLTLMGIFAHRLSNTVNTFKAEQDKGQVPMVEFVWECINIIFSTISFILNLVQIAKFIAEALTPFGMLFGNVVTSVFSLAILALDVVVYINHADKNYSIIALALDCALLLLAMIATIYGIRVYRRLIAYDEYHHPHTQNVQQFGFAKDRDTSYGPSRMSLSADPDSLYDPMNPADARPRRPSFTLRRTSSGGSNHRSVSPLPRLSTERRASYDHKRDTQFDDFVARRRSTSSGEGVDHAHRAGFGWEDDRRGSAVSSGTVPSSQVRPRGSCVTRAASWEVNLATNSPDTLGSGVQRGHSLVSVPEAQEEDIGEAGGRRDRPVSEDRQGLLGDRSVFGYSVASRDNWTEPVQELEDTELESKKRRRES
ncbi:hypothetical protein BJ170DRAFT_682961 [Xylariales sp. AK1849]|nr:hypothetical protein BJ170DRAFT_682961 [Xylariales sp. AK1849]